MCVGHIIHDIRIAADFSQSTVKDGHNAMISKELIMGRAHSRFAARHGMVE